jgi:integrase
MDPDAIDRVPRKHAAAIGLTRGYWAHSVRATFTTTALENGAMLNDVQRAAGHSEPATTKLYERRGYTRRSRPASLRPIELPGMKNLPNYFRSPLAYLIID